MKGILIIGTIWIIINLLSYLFFGTIGAIISTYLCMGVVWFFRKTWIRVFNI